MRLVLAMRSGPMRGQHRELDLGALGSKLVLGRDPGPGGLLLDGDGAVSRRHGELSRKGGQVVYDNLSSNGTQIGGAVVMGRKDLEPGAVLAIGRHEIEVRYQPPTVAVRRAEASGSPWNRGPLSRPAVRVALALYLAGLLTLAVVLALRGPSDARTAFLEAREAYGSTYLPGLSLDEPERRQRLEQAERLAAELEAHTRAQRWQLAEATCRRMMELDSDNASPIHRFAAERLGQLTRRR